MATPDGHEKADFFKIPRFHSAENPGRGLGPSGDQSLGGTSAWTLRKTRDECDHGPANVRKLLPIRLCPSTASVKTDSPESAPRGGLRLFPKEKTTPAPSHRRGGAALHLIPFTPLRCLKITST